MAFDNIKYSNDYSREHYRQYNFRVSKVLDQDIIEAIDTAQKSGVAINAFIRECIRASIKDDKVMSDVLDKSEQIKKLRI